MHNSIPRSLIILAVLTGLITVALIILVLVSQRPSSTKPEPNPTPTSSIPKVPGGAKKLFEEPSKEYTKSVREIEQRQSDFFTHEKKVGALLLKLPYRGQYLTVTYSYAKNSYIATIPSLNKNLGEKELDDFLSSNGVERSWIRRLEINYK